jgi:hypothetical protein
VGLFRRLPRFKEADKAASYLGLVPSTKQSAFRCYHGPITKQGNSHARWMLVQSAQHVANHPGPLGVFFRRLAKKKNRNVAVVATARKLVTIAWHMLKNNEPYRYAQPARTQAKLVRLRVKATGQRKKTGPPKDVAPSANYGSGQKTRGIPSLAQLYQAEGLPEIVSIDKLSQGEKKVLLRDNISSFVEQVQSPQRIIRKVKVKKN